MISSAPMSDPRPAGGQPTPESPQRRGLLRTLAFVLVNCWLVFHLTGIAAAPATVGPSSGTARTVFSVSEPYLQCLYLNHGFHYFAPQPGYSNLVDWSAKRADGTEVTGRFPNFDIKPRLLYHRYFMLSEFCGNGTPDVYDMLSETYAAHLCRRENADESSVKIVRHHLPSMQRIRVGGKLTDDNLFEDISTTTYRRENQ